VERFLQQILITRSIIRGFFILPIFLFFFVFPCRHVVSTKDLSALQTPLPDSSAAVVENLWVFLSIKAGKERPTERKGTSVLPALFIKAEEGNNVEIAR
jgi:hypothetical protein